MNSGFAAGAEQLSYPRNLYQAYKQQQQKYGSSEHVYSDSGSGTVLYNVWLWSNRHLKRQRNTF